MSKIKFVNSTDEMTGLNDRKRIIRGS